MAAGQNKQDNKQDRREQLAAGIIERGISSIDGLLEVSFGEWPVKGLDIITSHPQHVKIETSIDPVHGQKGINLMSKRHGLAYAYPHRKIFINDKLLTRNYLPLFPTLGHEAIHILQTEQHRLSGDIIGASQDKTPLRAQDNLSDWVIREATNGQFKQGILSRIFNNSAHIDYCKQGIEIQARLHETLTMGYASWGRMPQNKMEFFLAMESLGFKLPKTIKCAITHHPERKKLKKTFHIGKKHQWAYSLQPAVHETKLVISNLTKQGRENFWLHAMPRLYGELIEMYGDKLGRKRLGLGPNETLRLHRRYEQNIATIAAHQWHSAKNNAGDRFVCLRIDTLEDDQKAKLVQSLHDRRINIALKRSTTSKAVFMVTTDQSSTAELTDCLENNALFVKDTLQKQAVTTPQPHFHAHSFHPA